MPDKSLLEQSLVLVPVPFLLGIWACVFGLVINATFGMLGKNDAFRGLMVPRLAKLPKISEASNYKVRYCSLLIQTTAVAQVLPKLYDMSLIS